jgi:hypothetical protein
MLKTLARASGGIGGDTMGGFPSELAIDPKLFHLLDRQELLFSALPTAEHFGSAPSGDLAARFRSSGHMV